MSRASLARVSIDLLLSLLDVCFKVIGIIYETIGIIYETIGIIYSFSLDFQVSDMSDEGIIFRYRRTLSWHMTYWWFYRFDSDM